MATITKRKSKRTGAVVFRVQIRLRGYPRQEATFDRHTDAKLWASQTEADLRAGRHIEKVEAKKHTLAELIDRYCESVLPGKKSGAKQKQQFQWWRQHYGERLLSDVTPALVTEARNRLKKEGGRLQSSKGRKIRDGNPASNATVNRYLAALSHVFTVASKEWQWCRDNPVLRVSRLKEPRGRVRFLSDDERDRLLDACRANADLYTAVVLALSTGARRMEIWGLRWDQIDFARETIVLHETKNEERRVLPLKGRALDLLRERFAAGGRRLDTPLVFPSRKDPAKPIDLRAPWESALKEAKVEDFRWHDLRHTAASFLAMDGATPGEIAAVLGHKTLQMVKRYAHLSEAHTASVVERMNKRFMEGA